ncbi:M48 family metallopeptidase [Granulosicoccus antarcticus]|uniref:M48 family metallopeptidase n=1 Tax=Granulosicoccus antarcticus TaxID=437505 RepID=UPI001F3F6B67|nr:M48 family metallopeptidase [Granulosicoccus antarcticus]
MQTTQPGAIGLDRTQRMSTLVSADELNQGAVTAYAQVIGEANKEGTLNTNAAMTKRVKAIANRIIPTVGVFREDAKSWDWQVNVINSDQLNAWAMPGGKIAFYSGIIEKLQLTDAEIAAIMGHEISHALREHSRERASEEANKSLVLGILSQATGAGATTQALADLVYKTTLGLPNSRLHETESDRMGVELMARAGYDPRAAIAVWEKMAKLTGGSSSPEFLSTHPSNDTRIKDLTNYAAKVMPLYEAAKKS